MAYPNMLKRRNVEAQAAARALGWFSIALGAFELFVPGSIKRNVGTPGPLGLVQAFGAREIGAGVAILTSARPAAMVWGRVAGDLLDLAALAPALRRGNRRRAGAVGALAVVALATAIDVYVAMQGDEAEPYRLT